LQDSLEEQSTQGSFEAHGRQDVLTVIIGLLEHPSCVRVAGAGVTIMKYFRPASTGSHTSTLISLEEMDRLKQNIKEKMT